MILLERIGVDVGLRLKLEDAIAWAGAHKVCHIDIQLDTGANAVTSFDATRAKGIRALLEKHEVHLGLHTLSDVNVPEYSPFLSEAVDAYMRAYIEATPLLGAGSIVVHAGYHFIADVEMRMQAVLDRLKRMVEHAEKHKALLLENMNKEPADEEVHYLAHIMDEGAYYYDEIDSPAVALSFTANHAHLMPEGVEGFIAHHPMHRVVEVQLADCWRNGHEQHLAPGEGDFDFGDMFRRIEGIGFKDHYMNALGTLEDMDQSRHRQVEAARTAGVAT